MVKRNSAWIVLTLLSAGVIYGAVNGPAEGVDRELAVWRSEVISDVRYDLHLTVPESLDSAISGKINAGFIFSPSNSTVSSLPLDFKASDGQLLSVSVNGHDIPPAISHEHIMIPDSLLVEGKNQVSIRFTSSEAGINRRDGYLYTLLVPDRARCLFPCFDQPDLKASYSLTLTIPAVWQAVSNSPVALSKDAPDGKRIISFSPTEPLSTYLFAFAAGEFQRIDHPYGSSVISAYHRETDPRHIAQFDDIFRDIEFSLQWQQTHTGIPYPFTKYDIVVLPGFQFGGMEHAGATFYNDNALFLPPEPTPDEFLRRASVIAHETSHMWFGDLVTMKWFDDVWTKEVFANYYAAAITRELLPHYNHDMEFMRNYMAAALSDDRTDGRTSIRQSLGNLQDAGLIYNNIIYNKAPVMLTKLIDLAGTSEYQAGIRDYLSTYSYANATWDDLVATLDRHTPADLQNFSRAWVYSAGLPEISASIAGDSLIVEQRDISGHNTLWPQKFSVALLHDDSLAVREVVFTASPRVAIPLDNYPDNTTESASDVGTLLIPNWDGKGYGRFVTPEENTGRLLALLADGAAALDRLTASEVHPESGKMAFISLSLSLNENYLAGRISPERWCDVLLRTIGSTPDPLIAATLAGYLQLPLSELSGPVRDAAEERLFMLADSHPDASVRTALLRLLINEGYSADTAARLMQLWEDGESPYLSEKDFMNLAYHLPLFYPGQYARIDDGQHQRLSNPDRRAEFDYIMRGANPDSGAREVLFRSLMNPADRRIEPWTCSLLSLIFHPIHEHESLHLVGDALRMLPDVKRHGDIFYPANWCKAVLGNLHSEEALSIALSVLASPEISGSLLRNKLLTALYPLQHRVRASQGSSPM